MHLNVSRICDLVNNARKILEFFQNLRPTTTSTTTTTTTTTTTGGKPTIRPPPTSRTTTKRPPICSSNESDIIDLLEDIQRTNLIKSLKLEKTKKPDLPGLPELPEDGIVINIDPRQCFNWDDLLGVLFPANIRISKRCAIAQVWMQPVSLGGGICNQL